MKMTLFNIHATRLEKGMFFQKNILNVFLYLYTLCFNRCLYWNYVSCIIHISLIFKRIILSNLFLLYFIFINGISLDSMEGNFKTKKKDNLIWFYFSYSKNLGKFHKLPSSSHQFFNKNPNYKPHLKLLDIPVC